MKYKEKNDDLTFRRLNFIKIITLSQHVNTINTKLPAKFKMAGEFTYEKDGSFRSIVYFYGLSNDRPNQNVLI